MAAGVCVCVCAHTETDPIEAATVLATYSFPPSVRTCVCLLGVAFCLQRLIPSFRSVSDSKTIRSLPLYHCRRSKERKDKRGGEKEQCQKKKKEIKKKGRWTESSESYPPPPPVYIHLSI